MTTSTNIITSKVAAAPTSTVATTTTTPAVDIPCATEANMYILEYKKINVDENNGTDILTRKMSYMDSAPSINGFLVGNSFQGNSAYLGRGWYGGQYIPGRIDITSGQAALYVSSSIEVKVTTDIEYFVIPSNCNCQWLSPSVTSNKSGLVLIPDPTYIYAVGLVSLSNAQVAISKVKTDGSFTQSYSTTGAEITSTATQVLFCSSTNSAVVKPTITYASKACAGWTMYTAYIGRAYENGYFAPGRVDVTPGSAGVYVSYYTATNSEQYITGPAEYLVITDNCVCSWISATTAAYSRPGLVRCTDISVHWFNQHFNNTNCSFSY
ncbi:hypothetical protein PVAND_015112 [Polypedilum vanderplanki]|uniref:Uncharacterized protein n=1 Tax=Polypedilum vanderplanki TaxID=319348 RepID=A0A9J6BB56_POLVA|nr:hypothetical protein PVAND_015112 [Polypedilum vanderplanki]